METHVEHHRFTAFGGSACEVLAVGLPADAVSAAVADVYAFEVRLSRFRPDSELSVLNARAGQRVAVSPLCEAVLRAALVAFDFSDGLVDAAVLPALLAAGYDATIADVVRRGSAGPTARRTTAALRTRPLPEALTVGAGWAMVMPGCAVDLGGVGKGWLADRLAERLGDAAVNLGGDIRVVGGGPRGDGWVVELCDGTRRPLRDAGVATSGVGGRRWHGGHHLIDPRTGRPADSDLAAVTVVAGDALTAEVLAKTALLLGGDRWQTELSIRGASTVARVSAPAGWELAS